MAVDRFFGAVARVEDFVRRHHAAAVLVAVVLVVANEVVLSGTHIARWDWLFVTGWLTFVGAWGPALGLLGHVREAIERLERRGVLRGPPDLAQVVADSAERWSRIVGLATASGVFAAFVVALGADALAGRLTFTVLATAAGLFVGRVLGCGISFGRLGRMIERGPWRVELQPGHIDGAAGLRPIGVLYLRQAGILATPGLFLATWWIIMPFLGRYADWRDTYMALLVAAIAVEILAFVLPMLAFHRVMRREKRRLRLAADADSERLQRLEHEAPDIDDGDRRSSICEQARLVRERYLRAEQAPTWPVDTSIRRRFALGNALLLITPVANAIGVSVPGSDLLAKIAEIFGPG